MYDATTAYRNDAVLTATPAQLVLMLYDGALAAIERARNAESGESVHRELVKAQDILSELQATLDHRQGGAIAANLEAVYVFCIQQLVQANTTKDLTLLDAATRSIQGIRDAWEQACVFGTPDVAVG